MTRRVDTELMDPDTSTTREVEARDNIIAIGYAERQIADSLRIAGKVNTEL